MNIKIQLGLDGLLILLSYLVSEYQGHITHATLNVTEMLHFQAEKGELTSQDLASHFGMPGPKYVIFLYKVLISTYEDIIVPLFYQNLK